MKYTVQLDIQDIAKLDLFVIDVSKDELNNVKDAIECELNYNELDMEIN